MTPSKTHDKKTAHWNLGIAVLLAVHALGRCLYVYFGTDYRAYLLSDMGSYWQRALDWHVGKHTDLGQWALWPPLYHVILGQMMGLLDAIGVPNVNWLPVILTFQILLASASCFCVWLMASRLLNNRYLVVAVPAVYAGAYPIVYNDPFILSENLAIPLLIFGVYTLICHLSESKWLIAGGLAFGVASGIRPVFLVYLVPMICYLIYRRGDPSFLFARSVAVVIIAVSCMTNQISAGHIIGPGSNGGINCMIAHCRVRDLRVTYHYKGGVYKFGIGSPEYAADPHSIVLEVEHEPWDQGYWYRRALASFSDRGAVLDSILELRKLWWGWAMPTVYTKWGSSSLDKWSSGALGWAGILALLGVPVVALTKKRIVPAEVWLLWSFVALTVITAYVFGSQRRFSYPIVFASCLIDTALIALMRPNSSRNADGPFDSPKFFEKKPDTSESPATK